MIGAARPWSESFPPAGALWVFALAWSISTISLPAPGPVAGNGGFVAGVVLLASGALLCTWSSPARTLARARALFPAWLVAAGGLALPLLASAPSLGDVALAARDALALGFFAVLAAVNDEKMRRALALAALALLLLGVLSALVTPLVPGWSAFEIGPHERVQAIPRFRGLSSTPAPAGVWALSALGLSGGLPDGRTKKVLLVLSLLTALFTFSIATLALPAVLAFAALKHSRLRTVVTGALGLGAAFVLYFHTLELVAGSRQVTISHVHPAYEDEGLGARYLPIQDVGSKSLHVRGHETAYGSLARRGLTCFLEHPLTGVGPGRFIDRCPVMTMNTFGEWTDRRSPHNQMGAILSELGVVGLVLLVAALAVLSRRVRVVPGDRWANAALVGVAVCSLGSETLFTLPVLGVLASRVTLKEASGRGRGTAPEHSQA